MEQDGGVSRARSTLIGVPPQDLRERVLDNGDLITQLGITKYARLQLVFSDSERLQSNLRNNALLTRAMIPHREVTINPLAQPNHRHNNK